VFFFPPLRGIVTTTFDRSEGHYGIDVVTKADAAVKSCLDGTVTLASWTTDAGHVIQVQHRYNLVSLYKHNSTLLRKVGDRVKAGEAIAIVGNSGELTTGPHLHFELWLNGEPVDPQAYMVFQ
jgi:murein DD-endopeptidase MepM/ murein hydrolase activator NlpD